MTRYCIFLTIVILALTSSCTNSTHDKQLTAVSSLMEKRDSLEKVYLANEFDSLNYWRLEAANIEITIKRNYVANTIDNKLSVKMNRFKSMQEIIDAESELGGGEEHEEEEKEMTLGRRIMLLNTQFKKVKMSLANLHSDVENNILDEAKVKSYIQTENTKVKRIENQLTQYLFVKNTELKEYIKLCKDLRVFADSISKKS
ncbi:MAG: hypothetical protein RLZZ30_1839 [Bacteroidota bacterium]